MKRLVKKSVIRETFEEYGIDLFSDKVYDVVNEIVYNYHKELLDYLLAEKTSEAEIKNNDSRKVG